MKMNFEIKTNAKYTINPINAVGSTNNINLLPTFPTFNDSNTIYFSNNGNDTTGTGTSSNPFKTPKKAVESCTETKIYAVCLDSYYYDIVEPITNTNCQGIYSASGEVCTLQAIPSSIEIPDGFITNINIVDIQVITNYTQFQNNLFVYGVTTGMNFAIWTSDDGVNFTERFSSIMIPLIMFQVTSKGVYFADTAKMYLFTDHENYSEVYTLGANEYIVSVVEYSEKIVALIGNYLDTDLKKIIYSNNNDGTSFDEATTNLNESLFDNEQPKNLYMYNDKLYIVTSNNVCLLSGVLTTGLTASVIITTTTQWGLKGMFTFQNIPYLNGYEKLYKISDIENPTLTTVMNQSIIGVEMQFYNFNDEILLSSIGTDFYVSYNGNQFQKIKSNINDSSYNITIFQNNIFNGIKLIKPYIISNVVENFSINNVNINTNCLFWIIANDSSKKLTFQNNTINGFLAGVNTSADDILFSNNSIINSFKGIIANGDIIIEENLFFDIDNACIDINNATNLIINHNTVFSVGTGIKSTGTLSTASVTNNIFYFCRDYTAISQATFYFENCILSRGKLINSDSINCIFANPLFVNELNDFNLKCIEHQNEYIIESPGKESANDSFDIGCYLVERVVVEPSETLIISPIATPNKVNEELFIPFYSSELSISGGKILNGLPERKRLTLTFDSNRYVPDIQNLLFFLKNKSFNFFENDTIWQGIGNISISALSNVYAKWKLSDISSQWKIISDSNANFKMGELIGYQLEVDGISERIQFNTENEIYILADSNIPEGNYSYTIQKIKMILSQESIKSDRLLRRKDRNNNFTLVLEESDI